MKAAIVESGAPVALPSGSPKKNHLESRHQELLKTQKHLQEQYDRLQRFHGTQLLPVVLAGEPTQPSQQCSISVVANEATNSPDRRFNDPTTGLRCDSVTGQNDELLSVENQQTTKASIANKISSDGSQPLGLSTDQNKQSVFSVTSLMNNDSDRDRESICFSLLLENAHETDIL